VIQPEDRSTTSIVPAEIGGADGMSEADSADLARAVELLENPSLIARITDFVGQPLEQFIDVLPSGASDRLQITVRSSLEKLLNVAVRTMDHADRRPAADLKHKTATAVSGAVGGFFGAPALAVELPVTTSIILRSIADIARSEGEDLARVDARLACLEVFALGGASDSDDASETGYFAVRAGMTKIMSDAAKYIAERGLTAEGGPVVARFVAAIAARFSTVVSEKVAAQAIPVLGAIGGASVNVLFMNHFQDVARGHFIVRRLERRYGRDLVRTEYRRLAAGGS
jgi:hypothetical protein